AMDRLGMRCAVERRVEDAESAQLILHERATARDGDALIPTLGSLAEKLRSGLGEKGSEIRANRPLDAGATSSFEAYRLYVRGSDLNSSLRLGEAIPLLRTALALYPDFAMAWRRLGVTFASNGELDSALACLDQALKRPQRLTTAERLTIEANRAMYAGDPQASIEALGRALQYDPASPTILGSRGFAFS